MSEDNKQDEQVQKVEIDAKTLEFIKSKADDMDKFKSESKELKALIKDLQEKLPAGETKPIKDQLLELLADKEQAKTAEQLLQEQLQTITGEVTGLKQSLELEKAEKELIKKQQALKEKALELKFQNPDLLNKLVDLSGDIDTQLKDLADANPFMIKQEPKNINQNTNFTPKAPDDKSKWTALDYLNASK